MLKFFYITNHPDVAAIADAAGVERIFVDLEYIGKAERQPMDTVKNHHTVEDVKKVRSAVKNAELLVRINPIYAGTESEISEVINAGADVIMLPMWKTADEVRTFIRLVGGRAKTLPLLETPEAAECLDEVLALDGIDEIHIGLNDLCIAQKKQFLFELLVDGTVDRLADRLKQAGMPFGVGGVGAAGENIALPAENILAEHYRLGSGMAILSRAFCNADDFADISAFDRAFRRKLAANRKYEKKLETSSSRFIFDKHTETIRIIEGIIK